MRLRRSDTGKFGEKDIPENYDEFFKESFRMDRF